MKFSFKVLFIGLILFAFSCKKNMLKKPTDVSVKMDINRSTSSNGRYSFSSGTINLASFSVDGERVEGDNIYFENEFPNGLLINFSSNKIAELNYDIPQGSYERLEIAFETFDDISDITIVINGIYKNNSNVSIPIKFEFMSSEYFSIVSEDYSGSTNIILDKDTPANALIQFNPLYWFDIVPLNLMENADLVNVSGTQTILINDSENDNIYSLIVNRIEQSTESKFN